MDCDCERSNQIKSNEAYASESNNTAGNVQPRRHTTCLFVADLAWAQLAECAGVVAGADANPKP